MFCPGNTIPEMCLSNGANSHNRSTIKENRDRAFAGRRTHCASSIFPLEVYSIVAVFARIIVLAITLSLKCLGTAYDRKFSANALAILVADVAGAGHTGNIACTQEHECLGWVCFAWCCFDVRHTIVSKHGPDPVIEPLLAMRCWAIFMRFYGWFHFGQQR